MRLSLRLSDDLAQQLSAMGAARGVDLSTVAREALIAYLTPPATDLSDRPPPAPAPPGSPPLEACVATLLRHWPPEIQARLTADMARTGLSVKDLLLGVLYGWATRQWAP
jgi:hypothetical protein